MLFTLPSSTAIDLAYVSIVGPLYVAGERWVVASTIPAGEQVHEETKRVWYAPWRKITVRYVYPYRERREYRRAPELDEYQFKLWMKDGREERYPETVHSGEGITSYREEFKIVGVTNHRRRYDLVKEPVYGRSYEQPSVEAHRKDAVAVVRQSLIDAWRAALAEKS